MVTRSFEIATPSAFTVLRRALLPAAALALLVGAGSCDSGGDSKPVADTSVSAKFCNGLVNNDGSSVEIALEVGNPPVRMVAASGKCSTDLMKACVGLPAGRLALAMLVQGETVALSAIELAKGDQWLFIADADPMSGPGLSGGKLKPELTCANVDPFSGAPAPDGGSTPPPVGPVRQSTITSSMSRLSPIDGSKNYLGLERHAPR